MARPIPRPCSRRRAAPPGSGILGSPRGQASVELLAAIPPVLAVGLVAWQLAVAGHAAWLCANAARVAARADAVGRSAPAAARSALPDSMERSLDVDRLREGGVRVSLRVPLLLRRWGSPLTVAATSSLGRAG